MDSGSANAEQSQANQAAKDPYCVERIESTVWDLIRNADEDVVERFVGNYAEDLAKTTCRILNEEAAR